MRTPETLTIDETQKLVEYVLRDCKGGPAVAKALRNFLITLLMLDAGLRVGEVVQLLVSDLYFQGVSVEILRVRKEIAKNYTERLIPLSLRIKTAIPQMAKFYRWQKNNAGEYYAFEWMGTSKHISTRQVERIIAKASLASIGREISPHVLRHTFATRLMETTNSRIAQVLLGHKHLSSTQVYQHPNQDHLKKAIENMQKGGD